MLNKLRNFNWTKTMFLVPIILVAIISMFHVVSWYDMANPYNWAIYLSIAIEVGAMTSLVAATKKVKGGVWFMFGIVTFIQVIGNIFYSYANIEETDVLFQKWIELTSPIFEMMDTEPGDIIPHKRWLALLEGGLLPLISLTSLHFYTKYDDDDNSPKTEDNSPNEPEKPSDDDDTPENNSPKPKPNPQDIADKIIEKKNEKEFIEEILPPLTDMAEVSKGIPENFEPKKSLTERYSKNKYDQKFGPEYTKMVSDTLKEINSTETDVHVNDDYVEEIEELRHNDQASDQASDQAIEEVIPEEEVVVKRPLGPVEEENPLDEIFTEMEPKEQPIIEEIKEDTNENIKNPHTKLKELYEDEAGRRVFRDKDGLKALVYKKRK